MPVGVPTSCGVFAVAAHRRGDELMGWLFRAVCTGTRPGHVHRDMAPIIRCLTVWRHGETRRHNRTSEPPPPPPTPLP